MGNKVLIEEIRDGHARQDRREGEPPMCLACSPVDYPCDAARLADALEAATLERDAALAAIERVRAIHERDMVLRDYCSECSDFGSDQFPPGQMVEWPCRTIQALDVAPEPEWEYGFELIEPDDRNVFEREGDFISAAFAYRAAKKRIDEEHQADLPRLQYLIVRRRKAGPWLPVEGESKP